jgi:hypothetical protein
VSLLTPWQSASARCSRTGVTPATGPAREVQKRAPRSALGIGLLSTATVGTPATPGNPS